MADKKSILERIVDSPNLKFIIWGVLFVAIITLFTVALTGLTALAVFLVVGYTYKFISRQLLLLKTYTIQQTTRISQKLIKIIR